MKLVSSGAPSRRRPNAKSNRLAANPRPVRPGRRLTLVGVLVLLIGIGGAGTLYWLETRRPEPTIDELLPGYSRANSRQMGIFYGKLGVMMWEWREDLRRPGAQAAIIVVTASLAAFGCFRIAWLRDEDEKRSPHMRRSRSRV
jgi:hypothetical protein